MKFGRILVRWLLIVFVVLVTTVAIGGFFLPSRMEVTAERTIEAPAAELYDRVASLKRWPEWAPWWQRDPFLETEFAGPESGTGAAMKWMSKSEGSGQAKITAVIPNRDVSVALDFADKGEGECRIVLEESPDHQRTKVTWSFGMSFGQNTGRRYFGLLFKHAVRKDLDSALERLETSVAAGKASAKPAQQG